MEAMRDMTLEMTSARLDADRQRQTSIERVSLEQRLQSAVQLGRAAQTHRRVDAASRKGLDRMATPHSDATADKRADAADQEDDAKDRPPHAQGASGVMYPGGAYPIHLFRQRATPGEIEPDVAGDVATGSVRINDASELLVSVRRDVLDIEDAAFTAFTASTDGEGGDVLCAATSASGSQEVGTADVDAAAHEPVLSRDAIDAPSGWLPNGGQAQVSEAPVPALAQALPRRETRFSRYTSPVHHNDEIGFTFNFAGLHGRPSANVKLESSMPGSSIHISTDDSVLFHALIDRSDGLDGDIVIDGERRRTS